MESPKCAYCEVYACYSGDFNRLPLNCPMKIFGNYIEEAKNELLNNDYSRKIAIEASIIEALGYMQWTRLKEIIEYCKRLKISKIGLAFCIGLRYEANYISQALENADLKVFSVCCKIGGIDKTIVGIPEQYKLSKRPIEAICNPIAQAYVLNAVGTDLNIVVGLCVGHDSLFYRYSKAPVVTFIVKDRVTGHNPAVVIYSGYYRRLFGIRST
ncbi:MAG: DUF1847 domain-containing protein [Candidatus Methanomethylicia archaeon]|nr:DUF1847 domain-containing protein [Candidatus Methanomethylicia archaeon]MCX8168827.1 DUF1847 domain-containing protein [Candidatus Methanomethylicia archaeon]